MNLQLLSEQPFFFVIWVAAILIALSGHEFAHALMATRLGDETAKLMGRLTLNPFAHVDPFGFMALILIGFGWGKPVPFEPSRLRLQRFGPALVGLAGPLANLIMATVCIIVLKLIITFTALDENNLLVIFLTLMIMLNLALMVFNLLPLPPLDGSKIFFSLLPRSLHYVEEFLEQWGFWILLFFIIFDNFLPVPILGTLFGFIFGLVERIIV